MGLTDAVVAFFTRDKPVEDELITFFEDEEPDEYTHPDNDDNDVEDNRDA